METSPGRTRGLILDLALLLIPWIALGVVLSWGRYFGPNAQPPWPIGDRFAYDGALQFGFCGFAVGHPIFVAVRYLLHRRRLILAICAALSGIGAGLLFPALAFAGSNGLPANPDESRRLATRIARKHYGAKSTLKAATERRAILATFQRLAKWGELKYLLIEMPEPRNLRVVPLQNSAANPGGMFSCPKEEIAPLFLETTSTELRKYGLLAAMDVFAPPPTDNTDFPRTLLNVVAKYTLRDGGGLGREREWKAVYYSLAPLTVRHYEFETNIKPRRGRNVITCSVFLDESGVPVYHTAEWVDDVD